MKKNIQKLLLLFIVSLIIMFVANIAAFSNGAKEVENKQLTLKFGHLANTDNVWHKSAVKFAEEVNKRTNGSIIIEVFPNESLGKEVDVINGIIAGTADFTITGTTLEQFGSRVVPLMEFPYLFRDEDHLLKAVNGELGKAIDQDIKDNTPLMTIGYFLRGPRYLTSNKPFNTPDELRGLLIRVPNSPIAVSTWSALGAKPTPMAFSEVFTALQQGTIEAQENPYAQIKDAGFYEVQKYLNSTGHVRAWIYVIMSQKRFNSLTPEQQQAIVESGKIMQEYQQALYREGEQELKSFLEARMTFNNNVNIDAFKKKIQENLVPQLTPIQKELYDRTQQIK